MDLLRDATLVLVAYALGCVATGYYLVRWRTGGDVRQQGSGSSGATNAMRALGKLAFAAVFIVDLAKGALALALARWFGAAEVAVALAGVAVVLGHIWPAQLRFRGGKGISTALGAAIALDAWIGLGGLAIAVAVFVIARRFVVSGLIGAAAAPFLALAAGRSAVTVIGIAAMAVVVLIGHRENIRDMIEQGGPWAPRDPGRSARSRVQSATRSGGSAIAKGDPS